MKIEELKDTALFYLDRAEEQTREQNKKLAFNNILFNLGGYYAILELLFNIDIDEYCEFGERNKPRIEVLNIFTDDIYRRLKV